NAAAATAAGGTRDSARERSGTRLGGRQRRERGQAVTQSKGRKAVLTHHSPLEGESARRGRKPDVAPVGGAAKASATPHRPGEPQGPPRLPLKGGGMEIFSPRLRNGLERGRRREGRRCGR
ncbi:MAG: hypothetical protein OXU61_09040, partial [Gammaproteobacteria bacterium]|nr:hypothetical protein [Gammaproteobacteria bacterium]